MVLGKRDVFSIVDETSLKISKWITEKLLSFDTSKASKIKGQEGRQINEYYSEA